jgi:hypothetical protein
MLGSGSSATAHCRRVGIRRPENRRHRVVLERPLHFWLPDPLGACTITAFTKQPATRSLASDPYDGDDVKDAADNKKMDAA